MVNLSPPVLKTISSRYSCRTYTNEELKDEDYDYLQQCIAAITTLFGSTMRIKLIHNNRVELPQKIGTYGFIKNQQGFIAATTADTKEGLVDFGYALEQLVLAATQRSIGTCWLGGTFTRGPFNQIMGLSPHEILPAVISLGYPADKKRMFERSVRYIAGSDTRKKATELFFEHTWNNPYKGSEPFTTLLELVRLAPSASNKQPWRILFNNNAFHFYLERTPGYYDRNKALLGFYDLQMIDMGIALCHFHYGTIDYKIDGKFAFTHHPEIDNREYIISYILV